MQEVIDAQRAVFPTDHPPRDVAQPYLASDPVCSMLVDTRTALNTMATPLHASEMRTIFFCCPQCAQAFAYDPQRFGYNQ